MLTDAALKYLKPKAKPYKVADRDGLYVLVTPHGTVSVACSTLSLCAAPAAAHRLGRSP